MAADEYLKFACDRLGLGFNNHDDTTTAPNDMYHFWGHYRISDSEAIGQAVTNARLTRVVEYALYSQPQEPPEWDEYDTDKRMKERERLQRAYEAWEEEYTPHVFMSFADYLVACRASANPPSNPNKQAAKFEHKAIALFRSHMFNRQTHSPDWQGYKAYLKQATPDLFKLLSTSQPALFPESDRLTHTYVVGTTGSGKSELLKLMVHSYILRPSYSSVVVLDPKGDLALQIGQFKENAGSDRLVYIDPALHPDFTPTLNPFDVEIRNEKEKRLVAQELLNALAEILKTESGAGFSLNMRSVLMPCIFALLDRPASSLRDLHRFMIAETNEDLIDYAKAKGTDQMRSFFENEFDAPGYKPTRHSLATKLNTLLITGTFADLTCGRTTIDLEQAMNDRKIVVFNLAKGSIGEDESAAFGKLVVALIQAYAQRKTTLPEHKRVPAHLVIDECQNFITQSIGVILEEARGMKVHMTLAQLAAGRGMSEELKRIVMGMTNVKIVGKSETTEERDTAAVIGADATNIALLPVGQFYARSGRNPVFKFQTRTDILGDKNGMDWTDWNRVRGEQLERYYRRKDEPMIPTDEPPKTSRKKQGEEKLTEEEIATKRNRKLV